MMTGGITPRRTGFFDGFDMTGFWSDFCDEDWNEPAPGDETIAEVETALGFRLPDAWVEFARMHNGGDVERNCFPTNQPTTWAEDHIAITSIRPIGRTAAASLLGSWGHRAVVGGGLVSEVEGSRVQGRVEIKQLTEISVDSTVSPRAPEFAKPN